MTVIYFDQAASSWPKPDGVAKAMMEAVQQYGANPGRGGHQLAVRAAQTISQTRARLAKLFGIKDPKHIIFFQNATQALNQAIKGFEWKTGDHVLTTAFEHNSVRRPLVYLRDRYGVKLTFIEPDHNGHIDLDQVSQALTPRTKLVVATHVSNVTGAILPIRQLGRLARQHHIPFLVDASQSAGILPVDVEEDCIDLLAFPGHKGLYGPQGTGGLYISPQIDLIPLFHGGTGSHSELEQQPDSRPARYESGTLNTPGIAGLNVGVGFVLEQGVEKIWDHEWMLTQYALEQLSQIKGLHLYGPELGVKRGPVVAFNLEGIDPHEVAMILDQHYGIATRAGLHCTPLAHQALSTSPVGTVRASFGFFNRKEEIDQLVQALLEIKAGLLG
ncbi:aminotransferase class V-fold PLP-dependent enzyme [Caldalkalibacillus thermarum TA2.A1]|uniref:cysteine desulfurase n=1 Tax=Caldalkalibacillus thermarum (strain TA2.A1) TaxID=986075 RepID=A0A8X8I7S6_CALTT|nr:aminotransferase class V-fold PLP-dependent enzyme [Caldalkalibacillus thermarum]QZT35262.1 aminotransferase class V-fold PLP-dependent enzyme [Caldalkalibacillus thermarum TA2.A1]